MTVSTMVSTPKKVCNLVFFVEAQELNFPGNLQGSKCDEDCIIL